MKYVKQFLIILGICLVGDVLHYFIPLPIPSGIYGIVILFTLLETRVLKAEAIRDTAQLLINVMPVMFIPAGAGLLERWDILKPNWLSYLAVMVLTTVVVMAVSGVVTQAVMRRRGSKQ